MSEFPAYFATSRVTRTPSNVLQLKLPIRGTCPARVADAGPGQREVIVSGARLARVGVARSVGAAVRTRDDGELRRLRRDSRVRVVRHHTATNTTLTGASLIRRFSKDVRSFFDVPQLPD